MRITDLNRDGGIGSNCLFVELGSFNFVVDSGLHPKQVGMAAVPDLSVIKDKYINFILITHCHLDHIGSLPVLMRDHPEARVLMSPASEILCERMLHNSCNVMKRQKAEREIPEYPLFTHEELERDGERFEAVPYEKPRFFYEGEEEIELTLYAAGHVCGAGGFELKHGGKRYFFTGDILFDDQRILPGAKFPQETKYDAIVIETTRGEAVREEGKTRQTEIDRLIDTLNATLQRGGSVLIPVFALGRMQEILTILNEYRKEGKLPSCPMFGAGLGLDLADYLDLISKRVNGARFSRKTIKQLRLKRPPRKLTPGIEPPEQGIYILSSGMLVEHTPSYKLAASLLGHGRNGICFVGYCDPDTPGGKLLEASPGQPFVFDVLDYQTTIRAQIDRFELSGHADREEILEFAVQCQPESIILTHGDPGARDWFSDALKEALPNAKVIDPKPLAPCEV